MFFNSRPAPRIEVTRVDTVYCGLQRRRITTRWTPVDLDALGAMLVRCACSDITRPYRPVDRLVAMLRAGDLDVTIDGRPLSIHALAMLLRARLEGNVVSGRRPPHVFRRGPVPFIHRLGGYGFFRAPRCHGALIGEEACAAAAREEAEGLTAAQRARLSLRERHVSAWDDISRGDERSWKRHRRSRWRAR